ncbi:MAG: rhodanese-like domain-containing protein [Hyphomicrobiaceae bacterium]
MGTEALRKIGPADAKKWLDQDKAILIDVREPDEYVREHIPQAHLVPLSGFNREDFPREHDKVAVFHCGTGMRTDAAASQILQSGFKEVYQLDGGLKAWRKAGLAVNENRSAPISIMRQVQIVAGGLVLLGVVLAVLLSPWFIVLSGFVGAGLMFAGISGTCAMAALLTRMPWNRASTNQPTIAAPAVQ